MRLLTLFVLLSGLGLAQNPKTPIYPGAVAGDKDLGVQVNRFQTTLATALTAAGTTVTLASTTGLRNFVYLGIDSEYMMVCAVVNSTTVSIGKSSCPNVDGRGLDGSTAATHASGAQVAAFLVAGQFNQLAAEIKSMQSNPPSGGGGLPTGCTPATNGITCTGPMTASAFNSPAGSIFSASGAHVACATVATPPANNNTIFYDTSNSDKLTRKDPTGTCNLVEGGAGGGGPTANQNIRNPPGAYFSISSATTVCAPVSFAGTITGARIWSDANVSATVDVKTIAFASYTGPASTASITASAPATIAAAAHSSPALTGWTTALAADTMVCFVPSGITAGSATYFAIKLAMSAN